MKGLLITKNKTGWQIFICSVVLLMSTCKAPAVNNTDSTYTFVTKITDQAKFFTTDKLRQIYLVTEKNEVIKYDPSGKELFRYNNNRLGDLKQVDVTNPFNILLYYPAYQTAVTLNRTLSQTGEFQLLDLNLLEVNAIGMSNDNNIWVFDENTSKLKKINGAGAIVLQSNQLNMVLGFLPKPNFILERENMVYLNDPKAGVLVFDNYGQYVKMLDLKGLSDFQVLDNQLIYREKEKLMAFHLQTLTTRSIELPAGIRAEDHIRIQNNRLFVEKDKQLLVYRF